MHKRFSKDRKLSIVVILLAIFVFLFLDLNILQAEIDFDKCSKDPHYVITFPIILRNGDLKEFSFLQGNKIGCLQKPPHRCHAENILKSSDYDDEAYDLSEIPLESAIPRLKKKQVSLIFCTYPFSQFLATPFYKNKNTTILSFPDSVIEELKRRYLGYNYDYFTSKLSDITGLIEDHYEVKLLVSTTRHVSIEGNIKIGVILPLAGHLATASNDIYSGIRIANKMKSSLFGKKIEIVLKDHGSNEKEVAKAVEDLALNKKVCGIIGSVTDSFSMAAAKTAEQFKVPIIIPTFSDPLIASSYRYAFNVCPTYQLEAQMAAQYVHRYFNARKASVVIDIYQKPSRVMANYFSEAFLALGGKIEPTLSVMSGQNISSQIEAIKSKKPDIIYAPILPETGSEVSKMAKNFGIIDIPILYCFSSRPLPGIEKYSDEYEKGLFVSRFHPVSVRTKFANAYLSNFKQVTGKQISELPALGADAYFVLIDAINRANSTVPSVLQRTLTYTKDFKGITGTFDIGEDGNVLKPIPIVKYEMGKFAPIGIAIPDGIKTKSVSMIDNARTIKETKPTNVPKVQEGLNEERQPEKTIIDPKHGMPKTKYQKIIKKPSDDKLPPRSDRPPIDQNLNDELRR